MSARCRRAVLAPLAVALLCVGLVVATTSPSAAPVSAQTEPTPIYLDPSYSFAERAADLVARMTLDEKASQMNSSRAPAIPRLGVREYGWWNEALHGVSRVQLNPSGNATVLWNTTSYPIDLALGATWDPELLYREAGMIADEAREVAPENRLNMNFWSPTINLSRDPRWGRNDESYGEDPYLAAQIAAQFVNGMEGKDMDGNLLAEGAGYLKAITTLKHYAANNSEVNRLNGSSNVDPRDLREYYTDVFRQIVEDTDVNSVMSAYNEVNDEPASASVYLLDNLLRQTFGFDGYVTSDCDSIYEIQQGHNWVPPGETQPVNATTRHAWALTAGVDLDCNAGFSDGNSYGNRIAQAIAQGITTETGLLTENDVDTALLRLFTARMQMGEFDEQLGIDVPWITEARARVPEGSWTNSDGNGAITETPDRLAMAREVAGESLVLLENDNDLLPLDVPSTGAFDVAVIGYPSNPTPSGSVVQFLGGYSSNQGPSAAANHVTPFQGIADAIHGVNAAATVTYYKGFTNSGTNASQWTTIDPAAVAAAAAADLVVVYVGSDASTANESGDRASVALPGAQAQLLAQVGAANPNTIGVIEAIGMMDVRPFDDQISTLLWSSYNGQQKGAGLADVLMGTNNPSGHLPFTWYLGDEQLPDIRDYTLRPSDTYPGRTYRYFQGDVSFPFGYGLSYTDFDYSNIHVSDPTPTADDTVTVSVDVTNTGGVAGEDVVELYATTPDAAPELERPVRRLVGFRKVAVDPGQTTTVDFDVAIADLAFFDPDAGVYTVDDGRYGFEASHAAGVVDEQIDIEVSGALTPTLHHVSAKPNQDGDTAADIPNRVLFDKNVEVFPQLTVSMSDDQLYGYIGKGESTPLPAGMTVEYSSNRPEVVSVDGGAIHTHDVGGAATVTATVSYQGVSESVDFVVYVLAPGYLDDIQVGCTPLEGFQPGTLDYSVKVPAGTTEAPVVTPVSDDPAVTIVSVEQATSVPGVATIVTQEGTFVNTYRIGFGFPPAGSSDFTTGTLGPEWTVRNDDGSWTIDASGITIPTQEGDLPDDSAENIFLQAGSGDWLAETHFTLSAAPTQVDQQVAMTVYEDPDNHLKLAYQTQAFGTFVVRRFAFWKTEGGVTSQIASGFNFGQNTDVWLRIEKVGTAYRAWSSVNGTAFTARGATSAGLLTPSVGFLATNGAGSTAASLTATVDSFTVDQVLIDPIGNQTVDEGDTLAFTVTASDSAGHDVTLSSGDLPEGATFDPATGAFSWTPDYTQAGTYLVRFEATDGTYGDVQTICATVEDVTPADQVADAIAIIEGSGLNGGNKNALEVKLRNVLDQLDKGDPATAISIVENDFVPQVQAFIDNGKLTAAEGSALLDLAEGLVANISQNS